MQVALILTLIHFPYDEMVDAGGVDGGFALRRRGPRPQLLLRSARPIESNRMWHAIAFIEWSGQDLPTEPDLDPSRTDGRGQFGDTRLCGVPKDAQNRRRGSGAAPHDRTCASGSTAVPSPHSMRRTRDAVDPEHHS
jgi:hypothetical protein